MNESNTEESASEPVVVTAQTVVYRYRGNGDYFVGIPARDLTETDAAALTDEQKEMLTKSGLYEEG